MIKYHINQAQRQFIQDWLSSNTYRPDFTTYHKDVKVIEKLEVAKKPIIAEINRVRKGYGNGELVPLPGFDACEHLPPGWAIVSQHDSGNNHRLRNAGSAMLTSLWNGWAVTTRKDAYLAHLAAHANLLQRQLKANLIV